MKLLKYNVLAQIRLAEGLWTEKKCANTKREDEDEAWMKKIHDLAYDKVYEVAKAGSAKHERSASFAEIKDEI